MGNTVLFEPTLRGRQSCWSCLRKMVIGKFQTVVGLDASKAKGRFEEPNRMLQEVHRVRRVNTRVQPLVLETGGTVDNVVLVGGTLPVLDVHLANFARSVLAVTEPPLHAASSRFRRGELCPTQHVAHPVAGYASVVIPLQDMGERILAVAKSKAKLDEETHRLLICIFSMRLWCLRKIVQASELFTAGQPPAVPVVVCTAWNAVLSTGFGNTAEFLGSPKPAQADTGSVDMELLVCHGTIPHLHFLSSLTAVNECVQDVWEPDTLTSYDIDIS